jgi:8-oxo-dGTP pyrophosphatase MutT (NUDIX family)
MSARSRAHRGALRFYGRLPVRARRWVVRRVSPHFTVGTICVVERPDGHILLIQHAYRQRWGIPGGLLDRGETTADAAHREVAEEVGLAIDLIGEPAVVVDPVPRRVDVVYRARVARGTDPSEARPASPEIVEVGWFPPTGLPELQFETAQAIQALARASYSPAARPLPGQPRGSASGRSGGLGE